MKHSSSFLNTIFTSQYFTAREQDEIISQFKPVEFAKHDFLLKEEKLQQHSWFLEAGFARSYGIDTDGNDITTHFYSAGDIVTDWTSFFLRTPTRETIQALTQCQCWQIDFNSFQRLFHSIENFREQGRTRLVSAYFDLKKHRVALIADQARDRYIQLLKEKPQIIQNVSLKHIASYLGVTDTSLSRIRKEIAMEQ